MFRGDYDRVLELKEDLLHLKEKGFGLRAYVRGLGMVSNAYAQMGRWEEAIELGQKVLRTAEDYTDQSMISHGEFLLSAVYAYRGDSDRAIEFAERAVTSAQTPGDKANGQLALGMALCRGAEPYKGIELFAGLLPLLKAVRFGLAEIWPTLFLAEGYWRIGEYEKGRQTAEELLPIVKRFGVRYAVGYAHLLLGEISLETNPAEATPRFDKSVSIFQEIKAENVLAMAYAGYGRYHKLQGNTEQARDYLTKALGIFERLGTLLEPDRVRKELEGLPEGG